jgi:hypothetical protein
MTKHQKKPMKEWTREEIRKWLFDPARRERIDAYFKKRGLIRVDIGKLLSDDDD